MAKPKVPTNDQATSKTFSVARAKCGQCGRELRHLPFAMNNVMCRECYGMERYRRNPLGLPENRPQEGMVPDEAIVA